MINRNHAALLKTALQGTGFTRRGTAFFRVWGDGVLQVLQFKREAMFQVHDLKIGIFSMYGDLRPEWFTAGGCIPRGSVAGLIGLLGSDRFLCPDRFTKTEDGQYFYDGFPISVDRNLRLQDENGEHWRCYLTPEQQIHILEVKGLPWLNAMTSQSLAAKAMYEIWPFPEDSLRFDAHLAAGELEQAEQTMVMILKQHADAQARWKETFSREMYAEKVAQLEEDDVPRKAALKMVREKDEEAIGRYLSSHYRKNCELARALSPATKKGKTLSK